MSMIRESLEHTCSRPPANAGAAVRRNAVHLADFMLSLIVIFFMVVYFLILFRVVIDVFRNHEMSGGIKALWLICLLFFPLVTLLIYVIVHGSGMARRDNAD